MTNPFGPEPVDLSDPTLSPYRLQEVAQTHPAQWDEILAHPNVYPGLADWIRNRQAEQAAVGVTHAESSDEPRDAADSTEATDDELQPTAVYEQDVEAEAVDRETSETDSSAPETTETAAPTAWSPPGQPAGSQLPPQGNPSQPHPATPSWGAPGTYQAAAQPGQQTPAGAAGAPGSPGPQGPQAHTTPGYPGYAPQRQPPQQQPHQQPHQPYGQAGYPYGAPQRGAAQLSTPGTWALLISGGAAFLSLFSFFFTPAHSLQFSSHMAAGGWFILLLLLATTVLSILQLARPSRWMRFAYLAVALGAGFMMFSRAMTFFWFFTMRDVGFSVVWMLLMSTVLIATGLTYLGIRPVGSAPHAGTSGPHHRPYQYQPHRYQQHYYGAYPQQQPQPPQQHQQPGLSQQYPGYSAQPGYHNNPASHSEGDQQH